MLALLLISDLSMVASFAAPRGPRAEVNPLPEQPLSTRSAEALQHAVDAAIADSARSLTIAGGPYNFSSKTFLIFGANKLKLVAPDPITLWFSGSAGINISSCVDLSLGNWSIDYADSSSHGSMRDGPNGGAYHQHPGDPYCGKSCGITFNLLNSTRVIVEDLHIHSSPYMMVTAFNGGGGHVFRRMIFEPVRGHTQVGPRDALHFTDQRVGPTIEDSVVGYCGDDLMNIHTTFMIVVRCETPTSCLVVNPHLQPWLPINTVYGTNSVLGTVEPGVDTMSFFDWPTAAFATKQRGGAPLGIASLAPVTDATLIKEAQTLVEAISVCDINPVSCTNTTAPWDARELWRVEFASAVPKEVTFTTIAQIDTISNAGTVFRNNLFTDTHCNLGRFKSSDALLENNTFRNAHIPNFEITWLPQFFEGPIQVTNVTLARNTFEGESKVPIHCGPWCENPTCVGPTSYGPWTEKGCPACPDCFGGATAWTSGIQLVDNTIIP